MYVCREVKRFVFNFSRHCYFVVGKSRFWSSTKAQETRSTKCGGLSLMVDLVCCQYCCLANNWFGSSQKRGSHRELVRRVNNVPNSIGSHRVILRWDVYMSLSLCTTTHRLQFWFWAVSPITFPFQRCQDQGEKQRRKPTYSPISGTEICEIFLSTVFLSRSGNGIWASTVSIFRIEVRTWSLRMCGLHASSTE